MACESERAELRESVLPVPLLVVVAVLTLGAGFAAGYGVALAVNAQR